LPVNASSDKRRNMLQIGGEVILIKNYDNHEFTKIIIMMSMVNHL